MISQKALQVAPQEVAIAILAKSIKNQDK